jgi:hypothetical protein
MVENEPYDTICKNCGHSIFLHDFMDYTSATDVVDCDNFEKQGDDISNLRYRKGLWETRGGLFD